MSFRNLDSQAKETICITATEYRNEHMLSSEMTVQEK
jgi:hypothetical protein